MKKNYFSVFLQSIGIQLMFSVVSMIFYINIFNFAYTVFTTWLLLWGLYSTFWRLGNKEGKMIVIHNNNLNLGETPVKKPLFKGAILALPHFVVNVILLLLTYCTNNDVLLFIETCITFPFAGFLPPLKDVLGTEYLLSRFLVCAAMYLSCIIAYLTGMINFSLLDKYYRKIIFKTPSDNKNK